MLGFGKSKRRSVGETESGVEALANGNECDTICPSLREYLDEAGRSSFGRWFEDLDAPAAARVTTALTRIKQGNFSNVRGVGAGVLEYRINFGPGYRIYFGKDGDALVILVGGGTKKRQSEDIALAQERWGDYKRRKAKEQ